MHDVTAFDAFLEKKLFKSERGNNLLSNTTSVHSKHNKKCHCTTMRGRIYLEIVDLWKDFSKVFLTCCH
jgi:hypothetical protein